jgi:hypothetical protein
MPELMAREDTCECGLLLKLTSLRGNRQTMINHPSSVPFIYTTCLVLTNPAGCMFRENKPPSDVAMHTVDDDVSKAAAVLSPLGGFQELIALPAMRSTRTTFLGVT